MQLDYRLGRYKADDVVTFGQPNPTDFEKNSNQIGMGVFTRHILNPDNRLSFFLQPYFEYNLLNQEIVQNSTVTQEEKANYFEVGVGLGMLYHINNNIRATLRTGGINYISESTPKTSFYYKWLQNPISSSLGKIFPQRSYGYACGIFSLLPRS